MGQRRSPKTWFANLNLLHKSLLVVLGMQLVCALVTGGLYYRYSANALATVHAESMNKDLDLINGYLESQMDQLDNIAYGIGTNQSLAFSLHSYINFPTTKKYVELTSVLMDKLIEIETSKKDLVDSAVYLAGGQLFHDYTRPMRQDVRPQEFLDRIAQARYAFPLILEAQKNPFFEDEGRVIPMAYRYEGTNADTYLVIFLDVGKLEELLSRYSYVGKLILTDQAGNEIFGPTLSAREAEHLASASPTTDTYFESELQGRRYITTMSVLGHSGWKIFALKDEDFALSRIRELLAYIFLVFFVVYLLESVVLYVIYRGITRPIEQLAAMMENQRPATYAAEFDYPYRNEIGRLAKAYERMMREIQEEEHQIEWEQKQKRLAEIKALQAQINPHFLYNTLNSISWLAIDRHADNSARLANLLASYYRTSLSKGEEFITVRDECEHARNYLEIQRFRYKEMFSYRFDIPEEIRTFPVMKIILQPLVENAIYHGIKNMDGPGHITISARVLDGTVLEFTVEDDGIGINADRLETINRNLRDGVFHSTTGYGIYNVNARIRLTYGFEYGLVLESRENVGTISRLTVPFQQQKGGESDDEDHARR